MCLKRILIPGIVAGVVILVVSMSSSMISQKLFGYDVLSLGGMRAQNDPLMMLFFLYPFVLSFTMSTAYSVFGGALKGDFLNKGVKFGLLMWLVSTLPSAYVVYTSMNYPLGFSIDSLVGGLISMVLAGVVIAKMMK